MRLELSIVTMFMGNDYLPGLLCHRGLLWKTFQNRFRYPCMRHVCTAVYHALSVPLMLEPVAL